MVDALLAAGADNNARNDYARTPLHWAVRTGHDAIFEVLLGAGGNPDLNEVEGDTLLHWAVNSVLAAA